LDASGTSGFVNDNLTVSRLSPAASTQTLGRIEDRPMELGMLILSVVGALLVVVGWFIDRALELDWLRRRLAVKADIGLRALDALRSNPSLGIERTDAAFAVLSSIWPQFPTEPPIRAIGRTVAYLQFGQEVTNEIGLTLFGEDLERIEKHDWTISQASDALIGPLKKRLHNLGTTIFFLGVAITVATAVAQFASAL
jgi:hypothetical protein